MTPTPLPPIVLTVRSLQAANLAHIRVAHNALAVALLASRNAPRPGVHAQAPNSGSRISTPGGLEAQSMEALQRRIDTAEEQHALARPDSEDRARYARQLERMDRHMAALRTQLADLPSGTRPPVGLRDTYTVTVPALHVRIEGVAYTADQIRPQVPVDPETPNYERYLGRKDHPGHGGTGDWPLWRPYSGGMKAASEAQDWHFVLMAQLWTLPRLPELLAVPIEITPTEAGDGVSSAPAVPV